MSITRRVGLAVPFAAFLWVSVLAPESAQAQAQAQAQARGPSKGQGKAERLAARDAYEKATVAFGKGDYVSALDGFTKANALIPNVVTLYWIALSQDKLGHTDAAIEGYEAVSARDDFSKLSEDKVSTVRTRLAELKPPPEKPAEPLPSELTDAAAVPVSPEPPPPPPPPPATAQLVVEPPVAPPPTTRVLPQRNTLEFGVLGGMLFVAKSNNLAADGKKPTKYDPTWQLGVRAAFFPEKVFGFEAEYAHGFGHWGCGSHCDSIDPGRSTKGSASFNSVRGHLIGQIPTSRVVPFALAGAGFLRVRSNQTGADQDFLIHVGVGAKVLATKLIVPRLDFRLDMTQKKGGGLASGIAFHPELLLGLSFSLGRLLP